MANDIISYVLVSLIFSILAALLLPIIFFKHKMMKKSNKKKRILPPGQMGLPWIGETMEFYKPQKTNKLFEAFIRPRIEKHGKIFKTSLMGSPTVVVNGADANKFFLSNEFKLVVSSWPSSSVQLMGRDSIMEKQGERHRYLRGIIGLTLNYTGLEALVPKMCDVIGSHLDVYWRGRDEVSLYRSAKAMTFNIMFECLLGIKVKEGMLERFERVLEGVFAVPFNIPRSRFWRAKRARLEIEKMLGDVVREKRKKMEGRIMVEEGGGGECGLLLSRLVKGMISGEISEEEVIDNVVLLVFAAHDTTSFAIAMTFKMLAQHQDCYNLLLQEHVDIMRSKGSDEKLTMEDMNKMKYSWQVVRESMRLHPPIFGSFRKAIVDIEYEGFTILKGWKVLWTAYGTHYEEEYFVEAKRFKPSRFEETTTTTQHYAYVAFGGGPRVCAGYQLARFNILIFLHFVVTRYHWSLLSPDEPITMDPLPFPSLGMPLHISPITSP